MRKDLTKKTWVDIYTDIVSVTDDEFNEFWNMHPEEHHKIMMFDNMVPIPRWQKLYGVGEYKFSGTVSIGDLNIPDFVQKCFDSAKKLYPDIAWNGALVNWYKDGSHYIGPHSDSEKDLVKGAPILSYSFGAERTFRLKKKTDAKEGEISKFDFITKNGSMIAMCGDCQNEYKHEITKTAKKVGPRINVTIRSFVNN
jgi:alkylated DNA repair dioxygenase AlkB